LVNDVALVLRVLDVGRVTELPVFDNVLVVDDQQKNYHKIRRLLYNAAGNLQELEELQVYTHDLMNY